MRGDNESKETKAIKVEEVRRYKYEISRMKNNKRFRFLGIVIFTTLVCLLHPGFMNKRRSELINERSIKLFDLMVRKKTNLCISADVPSCSELLEIVDEIGPYICLVKTHVDILNDFSFEFTAKLQELARKHDFLIFEDRKFADIGNTVANQFQNGVFKISEFADFIDAHPIPGEGVILGLKSVNLKSGLFLLAQMSSKDNLISTEYTKKTVELANQHQDFVAGFIAAKQLDRSFLTLTPGISIECSKDLLGQSYSTPDVAIANGADVIIVGRAIIKSKDRVSSAKQYSDLSWELYKKHVEAK